MLSKDGIESALSVEVKRTTTEFREASRVFKSIMNEIPSVPRPDNYDQIRMASKAYDDAMSANVLALREFNAFIIEGVIPERFKSDS
jgi:hypothetical protein